MHNKQLLTQAWNSLRSFASISEAYFIETGVSFFLKKGAKLCQI
jgi:hypothetical protein